MPGPPQPACAAQASRSIAPRAHPLVAGPAAARHPADPRHRRADPGPAAGRLCARERLPAAGLPGPGRLASLPAGCVPGEAAAARQSCGGLFWQRLGMAMRCTACLRCFLQAPLLTAALRWPAIPPCGRPSCRGRARRARPPQWPPLSCCCWGQRPRRGPPTFAGAGACIARSPLPGASSRQSSSGCGLQHWRGSGLQRWPSWMVHCWRCCWLWQQ